MYQPLLTGRKDYILYIREMTGFEEHWHSEIEIIYCIKGHINIKLDGQLKKVNEGCAVYIGSGVMHKIESSVSEILVIEMGVSFLGTGYRNLCEINFDDSVFDLRENDPYCIGNFFKRLAEIQREELSKDSLWEEMGILYLLAYALLKKIPSSKYISLDRKQRLEKISVIRPVIDYVEENYMNAITVAEAAKNAGYEEGYFGKCFKNIVGISFHDYLNRYRIMVAQDIMSMGNSTIYKIGEMVGIPDPKTFSRIFKEKTGMSPSEYRKLIR